MRAPSAIRRIGEAVRDLARGLERREYSENGQRGGSRTATAIDVEDTRDETPTSYLLKRRLDRLERDNDSTALRLSKIETRLISSDYVQEALGRHFAEIEQNLERLSARFAAAEQRGESGADTQEALRALGARIDADKKNREVLIELKTSLEEAAKRIQAFEAGLPPPAAVTPHLELPPTPSESPSFAIGLSPPPADQNLRSAERLAATEPAVHQAQATHSLGEEYIARARDAARGAAEPERSRFVKYPTGYPGAEEQTRPREGESKRPRPIAHLIMVALILLVFIAGLLLIFKAVWL
jgi:hypothetical protein